MLESFLVWRKKPHILEFPGVILGGREETIQEGRKKEVLQE